MIYETHVTVIPDSERWSRLASSATVAGFKPLRLRLGSGKYPEQSMLGIKQAMVNDTEALMWAGAQGLWVLGRHAQPNRIKLEAPLSPGARVYYEAHWKFDLLRDLDQGGAEVRRAVESFSFLFSRNEETQWITYLTARLYVGNWNEAKKYFDHLGDELTKLTSFVGSHYERVLVDTNPLLDEGWVSGEGMELLP